MKKLLCVLLIALTLVPLAACGREKDKVTAAADSADNQAPEASASQKQPSEKKSESPESQRPLQHIQGAGTCATGHHCTILRGISGAKLPNPHCTAQAEGIY